MICETCSCEMLDDAILRIHDERKWLTSPHPCPDCMERGLERIAQAGRKLAEEHNAAILAAIGEPTDPVEYVGSIIACDRRLVGDAVYKEYLERLLLAIVENVSDGVMFEARFNERTMRLEIVTTKDAALAGGVA